jgi:hypothetical protein
MSIPIALDSDDPGQPMIFESPGGEPPIEWPIEKRGSLQHNLALGSVTGIRLTIPSDRPPSDALKSIAQSEAPHFQLIRPAYHARGYRLDLQISSLVDAPEMQITLPCSR